MALAPWRSSLSRALHQNRSLVYARYVQLATVRPDGIPANRTIVFRGFLEPTNQLKFITDNRSDKVNQIAEQPWGEVCWYFPKTREQFRLLGPLLVIQADSLDVSLVNARQTQWQDLSDAARLQFGWPDPKQPRSDSSSFDPPPPDPVQPLPNFCLLLLDPSQVDHLELRGNPQNRTLYHYHQELQEWSIQSVNP